MRRLLFILLLSSLSLPTYAAERLRIAGSTTVLPIVAEAAKLYRQLHSGLTLTVSGGGSGVSVASVNRGHIEVGMISRPLTEREQQQLQGRVQVIPIARDAVAIAVSRVVYEHGVTQLTRQQIAAIYRGEITNWREVGGPDSPILVIDKEPSRGTRHVFAKVVLGDEWARAPGASIVTGSNNEGQSAIANSDKAIGMLSTAWLNKQVLAIAIMQNGKAITPSQGNVSAGLYPIQRTLDILLPNNHSETTGAFVEFLRSEQGGDIVRQVGYLPVQ